MNLSFPKANLRILESRIKYENMNNSYNNSQIDKNSSFQKSSDINFGVIYFHILFK